MASETSQSFNIDTTSINIPTWIMTGWATLMVAGRVISRSLLSKKNRTWGWDDSLSIVALVTLLIGSSLISASITALTKVDLKSLKTTLPPAHALSFAANNAFLISVPIPKIVAAVLFIRVFEPATPTRVALLGGCILMSCLGLCLFAMNWASCSPVAAQWNPWKYPHHSCWDPSVTLDFGYTFGALSAFQDLCLSLYPTIQLRRLTLSHAKKLRLSLVLGLSFAAGIFAIVKTWELSRLRRETKSLAGPFNVSLHTALWNDIENSVAIICTCVPAILPLTRLIRDKSINSWSSMSSLLRSKRGRLNGSVSTFEYSERSKGPQSVSNISEEHKEQGDHVIERERDVERMISQV